MSAAVSVLTFCIPVGVAIRDFNRPWVILLGEVTLAYPSKEKVIFIFYPQSLCDVAHNLSLDISDLVVDGGGEVVQQLINQVAQNSKGIIRTSYF